MSWLMMFRRLDWRIRVVLAIGVATMFVTLLGYGAGYFWNEILNPSTHFGSIFTSWVSGVALFAVSGIAIAVVSLARPELEPFEVRARILFRRQTGKHIDYIVSRITEALEHYSENTVIKITLLRYDVAESKYRVASSSRVIVRSYLDDVPTTYSSHMGLTTPTLPPQGGERNRLVYARVGNTPVATGEEFDMTINKPISCQIEKDGSCDISAQTEFWIDAEVEPNVHRPRRYTQALSLHFENLIIPHQDVDLKVCVDGTNWHTERLAHGVSRQVLELKDIKPSSVAYDYRLLKP